MHGITTTDQLFSVRETPWHRLGVVLPDHPDRATAQQLAHPWEPILEPVYRALPIIGADGPDTVFEEIPNQQAVVRSDNAETLAVVSDTYTPVKNDVLYEIAEALQGEDQSVLYETGGSINGGRSVWLMLRLNEPLTLKGDPVGATMPYFTMQNSHDGSGAFRGQATNVRVVCQNTMKASDLAAHRNRTEFTFRHTASVHDRIEEAKTALAMWRENLRTWQHTMEHLLELPVTKRQTDIFIDELVPMPIGSTISDRVKANVETARQQVRDILASPTTQDTAHTAFGLTQAALEFNQWYRRTRGKDSRSRMENRFKRALLSTDRFNADVIELAEEVAVYS